MSILEEKIRKNREYLDGAEPESGHLDRFQEKLSSLSPAPVKKLSIFRTSAFRVAAVIMVLVCISTMIYLFNPAQNGATVSGNLLPQEVREARLYYSNLTDKKFSQIDQCAVSPEEASRVKSLAEKELSQLDSNSRALEASLSKEKDTRIINALIISYKTKSDLIDDILKRMCKI